MQTVIHSEAQSEMQIDPSFPVPAQEAEAVDEILAAILDDDEDLLEAAEGYPLLSDDEVDELDELDEVDEIVDSVLDAADVEILEDIGGGPVGADGPAGRTARLEAADALLLRRLMVDVLSRYRERQRRELGCQGGGA